MRPSDFLGFSEDGKGHYLNWVGVLPDSLKFDWEIEKGGVLQIRASEIGSGRIGRFCPVDGVRFELVTYRKAYGKPEELLILYPGGESETRLLMRDEQVAPVPSDD